MKHLNLKVFPLVCANHVYKPPTLQVENMLLIVMHSAHLVAQRKAFQQSMENVLTLNREQTSSQPLIASALEELKVTTLC